MFARTIAIACVAATSIAAAPALCAQDVGVTVGAPAPGAVVHTLDGRAVNLATYIGGSPALIEFWAVWCGRCRALEPSLQALAKRYGARMTFITVAVSVNESPRRVRAYVRKHAFAAPVLYDTQGNAVAAYDAPATSYIVVVDAGGRVVYSGLGGEQDLEAAIEKGLRGSAVRR